jgi:hypothetical protein
MTRGVVAQLRAAGAYDMDAAVANWVLRAVQAGGRIRLAALRRKRTGGARSPARFDEVRAAYEGRYPGHIRALHGPALWLFAPGEQMYHDEGDSG